ncbi:acyl carrier protein [Streptomyces sp. 8K308]|uniref:acyl carrier protein n=1 Tax=Streptomyces sp. 8K308 TaxID=2530388 RepID=UPI001046B4CF|nr:acyl carrier protein [Streptomyces sp. 8K308]TDC07947.1 acyl carrier protein [Streptomyces sp. 8K308]
MSEHSESYDTVVSVLVGKFQFVRDDLSPEVTVEEVGLDSLGRAEFALCLRQETGVAQDEDGLTGESTLADVARALAS